MSYHFFKRNLSFYKFQNSIFILLVFFVFTVHSQDFTFVAVGDTGTGNQDQYLVAQAMENVCYNEKCEFVLLLGDNFYHEGVTSADDPQFFQKFEDPYKNLKIPFYVALGNHDYGKYANDWKRGEYQVEYGNKNSKWILPSQYYAWNFLSTRFITMDTSQLFWGRNVSEQQSFIESQLQTDQWKIVIGHHTYISNGKHGNAGSYDGVFLSPMSGAKIKKIVEDSLCGKMDIYLGGHDHNLQVLKPTPKCPNPFIVSGAGAKVDDRLKEKNPYYFQKATLGFHLFRVSQNEIQILTINSKSQIEHTLTLQK